jgi:hypothetical protein
MTTSIEVKCDDSTHLYWRQVGTSAWAQLGDTTGNSPAITVTSSSSVTFEFVKHNGSNHSILYKPSPDGRTTDLPTSNGPTVVVPSPGDNYVYFSRNQSTPRWYGGYVKVSPTNR